MSRKKAAVVASLVAVLLVGGAAIGYFALRPYRDGEEVARAFEKGRLSPAELAELLSHGANIDVQVGALNCIEASRDFRRPYDKQIVDAVVAMAREIASGASRLTVGERDQHAMCIASLVANAEQPELLPAIVAMAASSHPEVRAEGARPLGLLPLDAKELSVLEKLLDDEFPAARAVAILAVHDLARNSAQDASRFWSTIRDALESKAEVAIVRRVALAILWQNRRLTRGELASYVNDGQAEVAKMARHWLARAREGKRDIPVKSLGHASEALRDSGGRE